MWAWPKNDVIEWSQLINAKLMFLKYEVHGVQLT